MKRAQLRTAAITLTPISFVRRALDLDDAWSGAEICAQLKDPARNGGRDAVGLLVHLRHDASLSGFIPRGWEPGAGRSTPPGTFEDHVKDVALWGAAGQPCPD
jgi:hypothetical protein